jgi:hypothetical protein
MVVPPVAWLCRIAWGTIVLWIMSSALVKAQSTQRIEGHEDGAAIVRGTVLNRVTHEAIGGALVYSPDQQYATMTDDRGHFEFKFPPQRPEPQENPPGAANSYVLRRPQFLSNSPPTEFLARKPGFLQGASHANNGRDSSNQSEIMVYLDPEALITGHVSIPGMEGDLRIRLELYRRDIVGGQEHWQSAGTFTTWADGEFRFFDLTAGTYKLVTLEQLDRDPLVAAPGGQLFGYPPVYYPGTMDFSAAGVIQLAAGTTFQANITPTRREYYPVKVPVANPAVGQPMNIRVYPLGHPGPGYSLGYNSAEESIQGLLPDGSYTLEADTQGDPGSTGVVNFSVHGAPLDGPAVNLIPNTSVTVNVREEFRSEQTVFNETSGEPADGSSISPVSRQINFQVVLTPIEEFSSAESRASQPIEGTREHALVIPNVRPGRYRVAATSGVGYPAIVLYGGSDLKHEPFVMGLGGASQPIQVTLRDDGAEVDGTVRDTAKSERMPDQSGDAGLGRYVCFLPVDGRAGQFREAYVNPDGSFAQAQLAPGAYLVLAFDRPRYDLEYSDPEVLRKFESKGQVIRVEAGQKEHLRLSVIPGGDLQ